MEDRQIHQRRDENNSSSDLRSGRKESLYRSDLD